MSDNTTLHPSAAGNSFSEIEEIIDDIRAGKMVIMVDDENRENEGDLLMAAEKVRMFCVEPKVALLSHSTFGSHDDADAQRMRHALELIRKADPALEVEGEMPADVALDPELRKRVFPNSRLQGPANLLVMPDLGAAHIAYNLSRAASHGVTVGPILMGTARPVHVLNASATVRRVVNMTAIAAVDAQLYEANQRKADS